MIQIVFLCDYNEGINRDIKQYIEGESMCAGAGLRNMS